MTKEELKKKAEEKCVYTDEAMRIMYRIGYIDGAEPREKRIAELKKENAELKEKSSRQSKNYKQDVDKLLNDIHRLEKENAELRTEKGCKSCTKFDEIQLNKAKEIIKTLLSSKTDFDERRFALWAWKEEVNKAEQFLKDSEVEK